MNELALFRADVPDQCSADQARELTDRIKVVLDGMWELVKAAYTSRAWAALGYGSWDDYCTREFGTSRLKLPREERGEVVSSLRDSGLSVRAIATVTGVSVGTVHHELATSGVQNRTPEAVAAPSPEVDAPSSVKPVAPKTPNVSQPVRPHIVRGVDGKSYQASRPEPRPEPPAVKPSPSPTPVVEIVDAEIVEDAQRDAELDALLAETDVRFRASFSTAMARADDVWSFDVARIAEVYGNPADRQRVTAWLREMSGWCDRVGEALAKTTVLRSVGGPQ